MDSRLLITDDILATTAFFNAVESPLLVIDRDFTVLNVNPCYCRSLGVMRSDMIGANLFSVFPESERRVGFFKATFSRAFAGEPVEVTRIEYVVDGATRFFSVRASPAYLPGESLPSWLIVVVEDETAIVRAERMRDAVTSELQHRIANMVALISVVAKRTFGDLPEAAEATRKFLARLQALAETNRMLTGEAWDGTTIETLARAQLEPYLASRPDQITIEGPEIRLAGADAQALAMAFHELATNAAKHGVLGEVPGHLRLGWKPLAEGGFRLEWREDCERPVVAPVRAGFGTLLLDKVLPSQLGGVAEHSFEDRAHRYVLDVHPAAG